MDLDEELKRMQREDILLKAGEEVPQIFVDYEKTHRDRMINSIAEVVALKAARKLGSSIYSEELYEQLRLCFLIGVKFGRNNE